MSRPSLPPTALAERYGVLLEASRALAATLGLEELYRAIHRQTLRVLPADGFYITLLDADAEEARVVFFVDQDREEFVDLSYHSADSPALADGIGHIVADDLESESLMLLGSDESRVTRSGVCVPLRSGDRVIGALSVQSYEPHAFTDDDLQLLQAIADLASVAIENARHVEALERRAHEAGRIEEIGRALASSLDSEVVLCQVAGAVRDLLDSDGASVWMLNGSVARIAASTGPTALPVGLEWNLTGTLHLQLIERCAVTRIDDLAASELLPESLRAKLQAASGIAVPLVVGDAVAGLLTAGSINPRAFDENSERILLRLAAQAAVALQNAQLHASVRSLSLTDQLTGLPNRRHLDIHLRREVAAAYRGRGLSLVLFDLDDFKVYNDAQGHLAGDDILRAFAGVLQENNRAMNLVARFGGDEFVSVQTDSSPEGIRHYLERIRQSMASHSLLSPSGVTVSMGVATFDPAVMKTGEDLLHSADENLYRRKGERESSS
ncbi:MAG: sensor domain-containing diguanylate cyclase [Longimicrobiales bacterium]|nr:sensor domain-containing diguanylate cyclase [Longimicrobiales bacterium]